MWREATAAEKQACAEQYGFDSWESMQRAYRNWSDERLRESPLPLPQIGDMTRAKEYSICVLMNWSVETETVKCLSHQ